jgi:hypothetical protein
MTVASAYQRLWQIFGKMDCDDNPQLKERCESPRIYW